MNANELADWLDNTTDSEDWGELAKYYKWCKENVAPMLRQLQAENEALKCHCGRPLFETQDIIHTKTECLMRKAQEK